MNLFGISVKKGSGNSVHQERVEDFIQFLNEIEPVPSHVANALRRFIWGDKTTNGTGDISDRTKNVSKDYYREIEIIQNYFLNNTKEILYRVLVSGAYNDRVDYIYYGDAKDGVWCPAKDAVDYLSDKFNSRATICIGNLSFQAWNRATYGGRSEMKRGQIQLKWGSIYNDILAIRNGG